MSAFESWGLISLFLTCFFSATILPFSSELVLLYFLTQTNSSVFLILGIATLGNSLGGLTNYILGFYGLKLRNKMRPPKNDPTKFRIWIEKYGSFCAFFSWIPFIGDPALIALGFYRTPFWRTMCWMFGGKLLRYVVVILIFIE